MSQQGKAVTLRTMGNKDISKEPEMKELKRMIRDGELSPGRVLDHVNENQEGKEAREEMQGEDCQEQPFKEE